MKTRFLIRIAPSCMAGTLMFITLTGGAQAGQLYWNPGGAGGDGIWGATPGDKNWNDVPGAPAGNIFWQDGIDDVAVFDDPLGGIVTVYDSVQTSGIIQNGADYTIEAGSIVLAAGSLSNAPFVQVQSGTLSIESPLEGSDGMVKSGGGTLVLTAANPYTGPTAINGGFINLTGSLASSALSISSAATLLDQNGGLSSAASLINDGTLTLNANDTVASYFSNGGTLTAGPGTLSARTVALHDGSSVAGRLYADEITSNGAVTMSGIVTGKLSTGVQSGTLNLTGALTTTYLNISSGSTLIQNGDIGPASVGSAVTVVTNAGSLVVRESAVFKTYSSNGGLLDIQGGGMATRTITLNDGSVTRGGPFSANLLTTNGAVRIENGVMAPRATVASGMLDLGGSLSAGNVEIANGASLLNQNGGLSNTATVTNAGSLTLNAADTVATYISAGGALAAGPGTLFSKTASLNDGSTLAGRLDTGTLTSNGAVRVSGVVSADDIQITSGTLTNSGTFGNASTLLNIHQGAALVAGGVQHYALLTTSGRGAATWSGDLVNPTTLAPGGMGMIGRLDVSGFFANSAAGTLRMDLSAAESDFLSVAGSANLAGTLNLNQAAGAAITSFVPVQIIGASAYSGNFTGIIENLDGAVWFNPGNGTVTRLALPSGGGHSLFGSTRNQSAVWVSLYDDVIDPGVTNITRDTGWSSRHDITSGIASAENPDLLWALAASLTPDGLDGRLLNRLSPEVYTGFSDYSTQATRSHQRAALNAPALASTAPATTGSKAGLHGAKSGAGDALPAATKSGIECFAALDSFHVETDNSLNDGDYALDGTGLIAGLRGHPLERLTLAGYLAGNEGAVDGDLIDADALGWSIGLAGEWLIDARSRTRLVGAVSYGSYTFDGDRGSASATSAGWAPGYAGFSDAGQDVHELFLGVDSTVYQNQGFRLAPSAGLRYASGFMDGFSEETGSATGSPIALDVAADHHESLLAELALLAELDLHDHLTVFGQIGVNAGLIENDHVLGATFGGGGRPMSITAEGLTDDLFFLGLGAEYRLGDAASIGLGYRCEFRSSHDTQHGLSVSTTFRF